MYFLMCSDYFFTMTVGFMFGAKTFRCPNLVIPSHITVNYLNVSKIDLEAYCIWFLPNTFLDNLDIQRWDGNARVKVELKIKYLL